MKILKRVLTVLLALVILALAGGMLYLNNLKTRAVPDYNRDVDLEGLSEKVTVYRDSLGIPHIYAKNDLDLFRTVGYVMAQDRMWQMDLMRRITQGRLAEVLDPGLVGADQLFRALRFTEKAELVISRTDPDILECLEAYADGINQYIEQNRKKLPFEFAMLGYEPDPWELVHTFSLVGYMNWTLSSGWSEDMALFKLQPLIDSALFRELLPDMDLHGTFVFPDLLCPGESPELQTHMDEAINIVEKLGLRLFQASNNWAVSGNRSKNGMPLFSNDMHQGLMAPGIWYQMHQVVEGSFNITGTGFPCSPYIVAGHNEDIAWGWTMLYVDDTDFYLETINPADTNQYLVDGQWRDMEIVEEVIHVKGQDEPVIRFNRFTHRGPVVSSFKEVKDKVISMQWQGNGYSNEYRSIHLLRTAKNWEDFRNAVSTFRVGQNCAYADRYGNIGMQTTASVPIRKEGNGTLVCPGDTSLYDWTGLVPFEELPSSYNPEIGYVSSANNRTVGDDYPYFIGSWFAQPYRIDRIREMLDAQEKHGPEDFKRMQRDQTSHLAKKMIPVCTEALEGHTEGIYHSAFGELDQWDYDMASTSSAAMIFDLTYMTLHEALFRDELGDDAEILYQGGGIVRNLVDRVITTGESAWCDDISTPDVKETLHDNIRAAFHMAVDTISSLFGDDPAAWQWGDLHKVSLIHPMGSVDIVDKLFRVNRGPFAVGGSFHTVSPYAYHMGISFVAHHGSAQRHIFNTADWDRSLTVIPTGTSGIPASPHYLDQTELYVNNQYHGDHFSKEAVEANMKYKAVFE
jgi:penicillin amidase